MEETKQIYNNINPTKKKIIEAKKTKTMETENEEKQNAKKNNGTKITRMDKGKKKI